MTAALLLAALAAAPPGPPTAAELERFRFFEGTLSVFGTDLRLLVGLPGGGEAPNAYPHGALLSPDQTPDPIPLTAGEANSERLSFAVESMGLSFEGAAVVGKPGRYDGVFKQGLLPLKLTMRRAAAADWAAARNPPRPQTPRPPFPYRSEDVTFPSADGPDAAVLAGTLTLPDAKAHGPGPYAAAVLVSGSGPQDRDETLFGHKPFAVLADALTTAGVAVLRYDDRGVGGSTGEFAAATSADFAADALGGVRFLADRDDVDAAKIGVIGHSEGGLIAPMLASENPDEIGFVVLLAGPAIPGIEVLRTQAAAIIGAAGGDEAAVAENRAVQDALLAAITDGTDDADRAARLDAAAEAAVAAMPEADRDAGRAAMAVQVAQVGTPWMRAFVAYDPLDSLLELQAPALALYGGKDLQVVAAENVAAMTVALDEHPRAMIVVFPHLNHLFQPAATGLPAEYGTIETTFDSAASGLIADWVVRTTGAGSGD